MRQAIEDTSSEPTLDAQYAALIEAVWACERSARRQASIDTARQQAQARLDIALKVAR